MTRGVVEVIEKDHLEKALESGKKLRVKFGIDPTAPDLHLGHTVPLRKLRQFQDSGHQVVLIIGDFTARIGDPSGRNKSRVPLSEKDVKTNLKNYLKQAGKVLNVKKVEFYYNSKWFLKNPKLLLEILGSISMVRALERDDFQKRIKSGGDVTLLEALYSGLQGYDSVQIRADVEIGGTDQKFNMLMGRRMQRRYEMSEQDVITIPILEGLDGVNKMSKSLGNYVGLTEKPEEMFGKIMSISDSLITKYSELLTDLSLEKMEAELKRDPRAAKMTLARNIVAMYHSEKAAADAEGEFVRVVSNKEAPTEVAGLRWKGKNVNLIDLLVGTKMASSKSEARRLIEQGGVKINEERQSDVNKIINLEKEILLQVGKRKYLKISG